MKFMVLFCLLAYCNYALSADSKTEESKTEKRALIEGNDGVQKRNPASASPSTQAGIVYAETKQQQSDKSPSREVYATPVPQVAKFSDVLTGHGPSIPNAIESHLYSPVQVYQPRLGSPTTYEVSAPIPAQLAYTETKTYQAPLQNSLQYEQQKPKQFAHVTVNYTPYQQGQQQIQQFIQQQPQHFIQQQPQPFIQPQQIFQHFNPQQLNPQQFAKSSQPQFIQPNPQYQQPNYQNQQPNYQNQQPIFHNQQPQFLIRIPYNQPPQFNHQPVQYQQPQIQHTQFNPFPVQFNQQQVPFNHQSLSLIQPVLQGITYAEQNQRALIQPPSPREVKTAQPALKIIQKSTLQPNTDKQGAVSYASFSQSQPNYIQPTAPVATISVAPPTALSANQPAETAAQTNNIAPLQAPQLAPKQQHLRAQYFQSIPQPAFFPQQVYNQEAQSSNFAHPPVAISPTFPPVQYFGKFASQIFGAYPH